MKCYDKVKVIKMRKEYEKDNVFLGRVGYIMSGEIRDNSFNVLFKRENDENEWYDFCAIKIKDLEFVEDGNCPDDWLFQELPSPDPRWWCKVEDGYILNFKSERKNKIPYDYDS